MARQWGVFERATDAEIEESLRIGFLHHKRAVTQQSEKDGWGKPTPYDAMWKVDDNRWAIGLQMICEVVPDDAAVPEDALANWKDDDQVRFCVRPRSSKDALQPRPPEQRQRAKMYRRVMDVWPKCNATLGMFSIGKGVIVKVKWCGNGGSSREGAAMDMLRRRAPHVPVPEPLYHWKDEKWFCYFIIMREAPGCSIEDAWFSLTDEHKRRLALEAATLYKEVGEITSPLGVYANGEPLSNPYDYAAFGDDEDTENPPGEGPFTPVQLYEWLQRTRPRTDWPAPTEHFHFCHMDPTAEHIYISDAKPLPEPVKNFEIIFPPERQADLKISGIIDWERSGFFPPRMIHEQFYCCNDSLSVKIEEKIEEKSRAEEKKGQEKGGDQVHFKREVMQALNSFGYTRDR